MCSTMIYRKAVLLITLFGLQGLATAPVRAITLNFAATLNTATCTLSLNKSLLLLGTVAHSQLTANSLVQAAPFILNVQACEGTSANQTPTITISGEGMLQGGKWLFRSSDSVAAGMGVMLVKTDTPPNYNQAEIKNGDDIQLAEKGVNPLDQNITFYAGVTCGGSADCTNLQPGVLNARVLFNLVYR